jgi:putative transposase
VACRVLGVRRQGFYEWRSGVKSPRALENELHVKHIERIHAESRHTYGWPRVHAELTLGLGMAVNHKRVARLMREAGIQGLYRRRNRGCTVRDPQADPYGDLVDRDFVVDGPDELWMTDITEHPTDEGKVYCAAVLDAYSRRVVGWSIDDNMRTALVVDALGMAITRRNPDRIQQSCTPTTARNSPRGPSGNASLTRGWSPRWARSGTASTIPWSSRSGEPCNSNYSTHADGEPVISLPPRYSSG